MTDEPPSEVDKAQDALRRALAGVIRHTEVRRRSGALPKSANPPKLKAKGGKRSKAKPTKSRGKAMTAAQRKTVDQLVTAAAQAHGDYESVGFKLQEVTEGGTRKDKTLNVVRNRGGTAIERWFNRGRLDDRQMAAVMVYQSAYRTHIGEPRVTANYGGSVGAKVDGALEIYAANHHRARQLLRLFDQEIFFRRGLRDFNVWQNVVIFDEPAGVAGGRLGFTSKQAEAVALLVCQQIAHEIAGLVIDGNPPDLSSLLLDIDAPRRARG